MPIVVGAGVSYSPLLYRERAQWPAVSRYLRGDAIQPKSAADETEAVLDDYAVRIAKSFDTLSERLAAARIDALIVITADRGSWFDLSHVPQLHMQIGGSIWSDPAIAELNEPAARVEFACEEPAADLLIEELVREGFDIAEGRAMFTPVGDPARGFTPAASEALARLNPGVPIIPVSINCHVAPAISGRRAHAFGAALGRAAALTDKRLGMLVSGGLSGDPHGRMSGWIDDVFDRWLLRRVERHGSADVARVGDAASRTLQGSTREIRLSAAAMAAAEQSGLRGRVHDYMTIHAAATGTAFVSWEA